VRVLLRCGVLLIAIATVAVAGCDMRMCRPGIEVHRRYRLNVLDVYNEQSIFTFKPQYASSRGAAAATRCPAGSDGFVSGATLELEATGSVANDQDNCTIVASKVVAGPTQVTWQGPSSEGSVVSEVQAGDPVLFAAENVTIGTCTGTIGFSVVPTDSPDGFFAEPMPGRVPPMVLYRMFLTETPGCAPCGDNFVIKLIKE